MSYSKYPSSIDDTSTIIQAVDNVTPVKAEIVNRIRDAVIAVETELGVDPSREYGTVRDRLDFLTSAISGGGGGGQGSPGVTGPVGPNGPPITNVFFVDGGTGNDSTGTGSVTQPFKTITAALNATPSTYGSALSSTYIYISPALYDEDLNITSQGTNISLIGFGGTWKLGFVNSQGSKSVRNINWTIQDPSGTVPSTVLAKYSLAIGSVVDVGSNIFTVPKNTTGAIISGVINVIDNTAVGKLKELYVQGEILDAQFISNTTGLLTTTTATTGNCINATTGTASSIGACNFYAWKSIFGSAISGTPVSGGSGIHLALVDECEFYGFINIGNYTRIQNCSIQAGMTIINDTADFVLGPSGIINSELSGTFAGPVNSMRMDGNSYYWFIKNSCSLAGGATVTLQEAAPNPIGINAYSKLAAGYTQPAVGSLISVQIPSAYWLQTGQFVFIPSGGYYQVASGTVPTFVLNNLGYSGSNIPVGSSVAANNISPGGKFGLNAFSNLTANFTQPSVGANVSITVDTTQGLAASLVIAISGGGYYTIVSIDSATTLTVKNDGALDSPVSNTITAPALVIPVGLYGVTGVQGATGVASSRYVPVDSNDLLVWKLTDGLVGTTTPSSFANTGQFTTMPMTILGTGIFATDSGLFGTSPNNDSYVQVSAAGQGSLVGGSGCTGIPVPISLSAWYNFEFNGGALWIAGRSIGSGTDASSETIAIYGDSSNLHGKLNIGSQGSVTINTFAANTGSTTNCGFKWHHIAMTYDGTNVRMYYDGALMPIQVNSGPIGLAPTASGALNWNTGNPWWLMNSRAANDAQVGNNSFSGKMTDVRVANVARGATYYANMYQLGMSRY